MVNHDKQAKTDHPIADVLSQRYSPYAFEPRGVELEKLLCCLEAARWAASSYNEQPWTFLVARREDEQAFSTMLDCLVEANRLWAAQAGVLMLTVVCPHFRRNGKPNRVAEHDIGLAAANLTVQATLLGLHVHQMAGIDPERARSSYAIPESHHALTGIALGYAAEPSQAPNEELAERDREIRPRKPLAEFVFSGSWERPASWL